MHRTYVCASLLLALGLAACGTAPSTPLADNTQKGEVDAGTASEALTVDLTKLPGLQELKKQSEHFVVIPLKVTFGKIEVHDKKGNLVSTLMPQSTTAGCTGYSNLSSYVWSPNVYARIGMECYIQPYGHFRSIMGSITVTPPYGYGNTVTGYTPEYGTGRGAIISPPVGKAPGKTYYWYGNFTGTYEWQEGNYVYTQQVSAETPPGGTSATL